QAPRIVGGHFATDSKFNYIAYIRAASPNYEGGICTGSLIAPNVVLTAAHCTMVNKTLDYKLSEYQVGFDHTVPGANESFTGYSVKSIVTHPKFDRKSLLNDVALFFLEDSIASNIAKTVKIYYGDYYSDTPLVAAGYGITDPQKQGSIATQLMEVNLFVGSNDFCKANDNHFNSETKLCTDGTGGIDTCAGDSGGPLATPVDHDVDFALLGLTSFGAVTPSNPKGECAKAGSTGFYTRLSAFLDWIASTANLKVDDISISNRTQHGASTSASSSGASASAAASSSPSSASGSE
ncbi:trypsin-like serine protease, partial [Martensiomyces pterosporus]